MPTASPPYPLLEKAAKEAIALQNLQKHYMKPSNGEHHIKVIFRDTRLTAAAWLIALGVWALVALGVWRG
jgi:hypothetical protein